MEGEGGSEGAAHADLGEEEVERREEVVGEEGRVESRWMWLGVNLRATFARLLDEKTGDEVMGERKEAKKEKRWRAELVFPRRRP